MLCENHYLFVPPITLSIYFSGLLDIHGVKLKHCESKLNIYRLQYKLVKFAQLVILKQKTNYSEIIQQL